MSRITQRAFWSLHTHSKYSVKDALPSVEEIVERASELGYPALGLTDHGNIAGTVSLYRECRKRGIKPLPGFEAYFTFEYDAKRPTSAHMCVLAYTQEGYRNLARLSTQTHRDFKYGPKLTAEHLARASEQGLLKGLIATTGCWFGVLPTTLRNAGPEAAHNVVACLKQWFEHVYVELQMHHIPFEEHGVDEVEHLKRLKEIADDVGVKCVITQDSHYTRKDDRDCHETMKQLLSWSEDLDDAVFPGDGYHMVDTSWIRDRYPADLYNAGMAGLTEILELADVVIPELDEYKLKVPDVIGSNDPDEVLRRRTVGAHHGYATDPVYSQRIEQELEVVAASGFASYLLFTSHVCEWMREQGIVFSVRGSVSGSLLCFLLEITELDPIEWDLRFDRFLSKDRSKPPDIDIDVEHARRHEVISWLEEQYPLRHIGTWSKLGLSDEDDTKGSLVVKYHAARRKRGAEPVSEGRIPPADMHRLKELAQHKPFASYGMHAAGLLITPDKETMDSVPLLWSASSGSFVTAYDKDDVESLGLVKLDVLGLKTLSGVSRACRNAGAEPWEWSDYDDPAVYKMLSRTTTGVFQLEGYASSIGMKTLKPTSIDDIIAAMALFRPAAMQSGATNDYISIKHGRRERVRRHAVIEHHVGSTYGVLLYQEQIVGVMRDLGMESEHLNSILKAVKASNANVGGAAKFLREISPEVRKLCKDNGVGASDINWVLNALEAYAGYSFNKAHATAYGVLSYATAWLRCKHPGPFWAGMLNAYVGDKQEPEYKEAAKKDGVKFAKANVNTPWVPGDGYAWIDGMVYRGLNTIKGVGDSAVNEIIAHQPYTSLNDLGERVNRRLVTGCNDMLKYGKPAVAPGVIGALHRAGALDGLGWTPPPKPVRKSRKKETNV